MVNLKEVFKQITKFGIAGAFSTLAYGVLAIALSFTTNVPAFNIHIISYFSCIPISYSLQKTFTFQYQGNQLGSLGRFVILSLLAFIMSSSVVLVFEMLALNAIYGTLCVMVIVPFTSFLAMKLWIFK